MNSTVTRDPGFKRRSSAMTSGSGMSRLNGVGMRCFPSNRSMTSSSGLPFTRCSTAHIWPSLMMRSSFTNTSTSSAVISAA